jgi:hypothetical protein
MSTKFNIAATAAFLTLAAAPQLASAQEGFGNYAAAGHAPAAQNVSTHYMNRVPVDARASVGKVKHHRAFDSAGPYRVPADELPPVSNSLYPIFQNGGGG